VRRARLVQHADLSIGRVDRRVTTAEPKNSHHALWHRRRISTVERPQ
jgi:hypothetical protein